MTIRRRRVIQEDRLSTLPDEILHMILSDLPIKSQIKTSFLSARWRHLWSLNPAFHLLDWVEDYSYFFNQDHCFLGRLLQQRRLSHILELQADFTNFILSNHLTSSQASASISLPKKWSDFVASMFLQHLSLQYRYDNGPPFAQYMERGLTSLKSLYLKRVHLTDGPPLAQYLETGLRWLSVLHLTEVPLTDADLNSLVSVCPLLESLKLSSCEGLVGVVISSTTLKSLEVNGDGELETIVIVSAPMLVNLVSSSGYICYGPVVSIENSVPYLHSATLIRGLYCDPDHLMPMIPSISHVRVLSIDLLLLKELVENKEVGISHIDLFGELKELHLSGDFITDPLLDALHIFLRRQPSIEKLCLQLGDGQRISPCLYDSYSETKDTRLYRESPYTFHEYVGRVYECNNGTPSFSKLKNCRLMTHLRIARVIGFMGTCNEMRLVKFILGSASNLESLRLFCCNSLPKKLIENLSRCRRSSINACIMVAGEEDDMNVLCKQPGAELLHVCSQVTEENQYVSVCPRHSPLQYPYSRIKSIYVHQSKRKGEKVKPMTLQIQEEGWTQAGSIGGRSRTNKAHFIHISTTNVSTHNHFEVLSIAAQEATQQDIGEIQQVSSLKYASSTTSTKEIIDEVRFETPTTSLGLADELLHNFKDINGVKGPGVKNNSIFKNSSSTKIDETTSSAAEEEDWTEYEEEIEYKDLNSDVNCEENDPWDDCWIRHYEDYKGQNTRKRRSLEKESLL